MATAGTLRRVWDNGAIEASCGPAGWTSADPGLAGQLETLYPSSGSVVGVPWVRAFWAAVKDLGAEVVTEPVPDDEGPDVIH